MGRYVALLRGINVGELTIRNWNTTTALLRLMREG